jgi:hypothetical protein
MRTRLDDPTIRIQELTGAPLGKLDDEPRSEV